MATTTVDSVTLTVTTVEVFLNTMKLVNRLDLWDEIEQHLASHGKTEMFFDYEVLHHFREMLTDDPRLDPDDPVVKTLFGHNIPTARFFE